MTAGLDLVVPHRDGGQSYVYLNDGRGGFSSGTGDALRPKDAAIRMAEVADLDRDGRLDIVVIDERRGAGIYFGRADGQILGGAPARRREGDAVRARGGGPEPRRHAGHRGRERRGADDHLLQ
jgi:hypothetical protein